MNKILIVALAIVFATLSLPCRAQQASVEQLKATAVSLTAESAKSGENATFQVCKANNGYALCIFFPGADASDFADKIYTNSDFAKGMARQGFVAVGIRNTTGDKALSQEYVMNVTLAGWAMNDRCADSGVHDAAECIAVMLAESQHDPAKKVTALRAFIQRYPNSVAKKGILERLALMDASKTQAPGTQSLRPSATAASNAAAIPGRLSSEQMKAIFAAGDEENRRAFSDLVQQTSAVPSALLSIQDGIRQKYPRMGGTDNCRGRTSELQSRLGRSLTPKQIDDIVEMNGVLMGCAGQYFEFAPPNSRNITVSANQAVADAKRRQQQIESAKNAILQVEAALDAGDLSRSNQLDQQLASDSNLPPFATSYLQQTQDLREDLRMYAQALKIDNGQSAFLLQRLQSLTREVSLLNDCGSKRPLTRAYLQHAIKDGVDAARQQLAKLPTFQFNEASYEIPATISENDKLTLISGYVRAIDESLAKVSEARAIIAQPEAMKTVGEVLGGTEAARLKTTADQIAAAENARGSLVDAQNSLQAKIAAENRAREQAEQERLAAIEAKRQAEARKQAANRQAEARKQAELIKAQDEGIASFLSANIPDSDDDLGISNRVVLIQGDDLVVGQIMANDRISGQANTVIKVRLSETFLAKAAGTEVDITCDIPRDNRGDGLTLNRVVDCVHLYVGVYVKGMKGIKITNVRNAAEVSQKLDQLILLHHNSRYGLQ